jgi:hypothetical protein
LIDQPRLLVGTHLFGDIFTVDHWNSDGFERHFHAAERRELLLDRVLGLAHA